MLLTVVQLQSICHLGEVPVKVTQFQRFCFSVRGFIYHKIEARDWRNDNLWLQLPLLCLCWWYNLFLKRSYFYKHMVDIWFFFFFIFSFFSWLKPNLRKSEIAGIEVLKGVQVAICGMRCIDLNNNTLKILGTHHSYNKKLKEEKKF